MTTLVQGLEKAHNKTTTLNGAKIKKSSLNEVVDLFFAAGASRGKNIQPLIEKALAADVDLTVRTMLYVRDARKGMGERQLYRNFLTNLANSKPDLAERLIGKTIELGRYDDLFALIGTPVEDMMLQAYCNRLTQFDGLAAKWAPREKSSKKAIAYKLRKTMGLTPKAYRKLLSEATEVVETPMCAKQWDSIDFNKVPSLAASRYQTAFNRNAPVSYKKYKDSLVTNDGTAKINAGAVYPYDVIKGSRFGDNIVSQAQWEALPDYIPNGRSFLPMIDVSGSMTASAGNSSMSCMDVAVSLGIYCAQRNKSAFKDTFLTFSQYPSFVSLSGLSLKSALEKTYRADWGMNTNLEAAYTQILDVASKNKVPQEEMPEFLIIFSDMQFDISTKGRGVNKDIVKKFKDAGYEVPKLVYWNLRDYGTNTPVEFTKEGTALVSGFSPALMQSVLSAETDKFTPINIVKDTVMVSRYDW